MTSVGRAVMAGMLLMSATPLRAQTATNAPAPPPAGAQAPAAPPAAPPHVLPSWLELHAEQRTRYETIDARYRPAEVGSDQQLDFRTRLQARVGTARWWGYTEIQDSRIALDDSASTIGTGAVVKTKVEQLHVGVAWKNLGASKVGVQIEAGRFSRDIGSRRLISRNVYGNSTTNYDGLLARAGTGTWSALALATRPVFYTYPALTRDPRFDHLSLSGLYLTNSKRRGATVELYGLAWRDGSGMAAASRRALNTVGARMLGSLGPGRRTEYEVELAYQGGHVGTRTHDAWLQHAQAGYTFSSAPWKPRVLALWDYASGDADPTDAHNDSFDPLIGDRRFEFGPIGLYGLIPRSNIISPGAWAIVKPTAPLETWLQVRGLWLAEARDRWRSVNLGDATGAAGTHIGTQVEWRTRYRVTPHVEFDGGVTVLRESHFVQVLKPSPHGRAVHLYAGVDFRY